MWTLLCLLIVVAANHLPSIDADDVVSSTAEDNCFKTNYPGSPEDFYNSPNGLTWNFQLPTFGFDWPLLKALVPVDHVKFASSDNMAYFRIVFTKSDNSKITTDPIYPSQTSTDLKKVGIVKRVDFYFAPEDFKLNVTITGLELDYCGPSIGLGACIAFSIFSDITTLLTLGFIQPGKSGVITYNNRLDLPFVEIDLSCSGDGASEFNKIEFDSTVNFDLVKVKFWDGAATVPVFDEDGVAKDTFNVVDGIVFQFGLRASRIRVKFIPRAIPNEGISYWIGFTNLQIYANEDED